MEFKTMIEKAWKTGCYNEFSQNFPLFLTALEEGKIRAAEFNKGKWRNCSWVKKGILLGFKFGSIIKYEYSSTKFFFDKDSFPERSFDFNDYVRIVPGGSSVRRGAYIGKSVIIMPPSYVNVGAYVSDGCLIDSHALVGTCAQIGKNVHLSAAAQIGGVIEPVGAKPVIVEDNVFIGGNCGIYEGVIIKENAIIAAGVVITASVPVYDAVNDSFLQKNEENDLIIPSNAVVVSGSRPLKNSTSVSVYCPVIIKYRDAKSNTSVELENLIR